jgi:hypothetical protein
MTIKTANHYSTGSRRSFIKKATYLGLSSTALNSSLMGANLLWARGALAADSVAPKRLITIHVTNGAFPSTWHAVGQGKSFTLPEGSSPLGAAGVREHCLFLDGLTGEGGHGHHHQCVSNNQKTSLDIYAANKIGASTPYKSLHLAAFPEGSLSRINGNGIPFELNPVKVYDRLFPAPLGDGQRDWQTIRRQGVFGSNLKLLEEFRKGLNTTQAERLNLHAESINAVSERIQRAAAAANGSGACTRPFWDGSLADSSILNTNDGNDALTGQATDLRTKLSMDLISMAFKCDLTRVATFSFGNSSADIMLPFGEGWHNCQHGYNNAANNAKGRKFFSEQMAYLIKLLAAEPDVDGRTLLDNTLIYLTSDMGDGGSHDNKRHPIVLAGGLINGGQAMDMKGIFWDPLFDTIAGALGITLDDPDYPQFGNGKGPISGIIKA